MHRLTRVLAAGCVDRGVVTCLSRSGAFCSSSQAGTAEAGVRIGTTVGAELVLLVLADAALVRQHPDEWTSVRTGRKRTGWRKRLGRCRPGIWSTLTSWCAVADRPRFDHEGGRAGRS